MKSLHITFEADRGIMMASVSEDYHLLGARHFEGVFRSSTGFKEVLTWAEPLLLDEDDVNVPCLIAILENDELTRLQRKTWETYQRYPVGLTAEEAAAISEEDPRSIRPRVSELHDLGFLIDTGVRRKTAAGRTARVFRPINLNR